MHGSIFILLKEYVLDRFDSETWLKLLENAGMTEETFAMNQNYPFEIMVKIVSAASQMTGTPAPAIIEDFGVFLVPHLLKMYASAVDPSWKTYDILLHTEKVIHKAVRGETGNAKNANPPVLNITRIGDRVLMIDYFSRRKLGSLAIGIIRGIIIHYGESGKVKVIPRSDPSAERVQIRVEFE